MISKIEYERLKQLNTKFEMWRNGAIEVYEFVHFPPDRYFAYVKVSTLPNEWVYGWLQTWTGDNLGTITAHSEFRSNFGDKRVSITVNAVNGFTYHGTYYKSAGDYARIKRAKPTRTFRSWGCGEDHGIYAVGKCEHCHKTVYAVHCEKHACDDSILGDPDPRSIKLSVRSRLSAEEYDMTGRDVIACFECTNNRNSYESLLTHARTNIWKRGKC